MCFCVRRLSRLALECLCFGLGIVFPPATSLDQFLWFELPGLPTVALSRDRTPRGPCSNLSRIAHTARRNCPKQSGCIGEAKIMCSRNMGAVQCDRPDRNSDHPLRLLALHPLSGLPGTGFAREARRPSEDARRV